MSRHFDGGSPESIASSARKISLPVLAPAGNRQMQVMTGTQGIMACERHFLLNHGHDKMIKISVMYPHAPGARFDHAYYSQKHMPLVKSRMGESCRYYTVDRGLAGGAPGTAPTYLAMSHIFCDSVEAFQNSFGPHADEIMQDIPNFTDIPPVIQISEVLVDRA